MITGLSPIAYSSRAGYKGDEGMRLFELTAHEVRDRLKKRQISVKEVLDDTFSRIDAVEDKVEAFLLLAKEEAYQKAEELDRRFKEGDTLDDLAGIPMAIKDNICTNGIRTTCASKMLESFVPPYDAEVYDRLQKAGGILVGKTNMDEFAMGSSNENSAYKKTRNPWDTNRVPGGSSGGSAASVAAGEAYFSLGSDTGGSIRQPAALCGLVAMKPTYGLVSRYGLVAFASSLDQVGPFTKDVEDMALVMNCISGYDPKDSTSLNVERVDYKTALQKNIKGMRIGLPVEYFGEGIDPLVKATVQDAAKTFEKLGAYVEETSLPYSKYALPVYYIAASAEASSNLSRYDGVRYGYRAKTYKDLVDLYVKSRSEGFGDEVKRRIMLGTYTLSSGYYDAYYKKALQVRTLIRQDFDKAFEQFDVLISPTTPSTAFKIGEKLSNPLEMYLSDICTVPANISGIPALTIPCGLIEGLPVGMQIMGKALEEKTLIRAAYAFEKSTGCCSIRPGL